MKTKSRWYWELILISGVVIIFDQITKYIVRSNLALRETWMPVAWLEPYARIIHWKNTGVAFGLFQGRGWLFTLIGLAVVLMILVIYRRTLDHKQYWRIALALQLGGALGNLIDRINPEVGYVVDFIWVGNFPVFNIADIAIVGGAAILIIGMWLSDDDPKEPLQNLDMPESLPLDEDETTMNALPAETGEEVEDVAEEEDEFILPELPGRS